MPPATESKHRDKLTKNMDKLAKQYYSMTIYESFNQLNNFVIDSGFVKHSLLHEQCSMK